MDDKNARLESERIAGRSDDDRRTPERDLGRHDDEDATGDERARQIRAEIEETRGEMSETVNAIQERLRPGHLAASAADKVRDKAGSVAMSVRDAAATAAGTAREAMSGAAGTVREAASNAAGTAREAMSGAAGTLREAASNAAGTVRQGASNAAGTVREVADTAAAEVRAVAGGCARDFAGSEPARYLRQNPAQSAMLAAGIGGLAWMLCGPQRSTRGGRRLRRPLHPSDPRSSRSETAGLGDSRVQYDAGAEYGRLGSSEAREMATSGGRGTGQWGGTDDWAGAPRIAEDQASGSAQDVQEHPGGARRVGSHERRAGSGNALVIGVAAAIVGAIVGAAISEALRENEWLGESRDSLEPLAQPPSWQGPGGFGGVV